MSTAIITGASRGIGREIALQLAKQYNNIAITSYKHPEQLTKVADIIEHTGAKCYVESGDIGDYKFAENFIQNVTARFGENIDLLINNAAISYVGLLTDMTIEDFDLTMKTNIYSVFNTCRQVVPYMVKQKNGKIINISSVWGNVGASCEVAYSASKGAVNSFTKALAKELAPSNISVNAIAFGAVDTEMNSHLSTEDRQLLADEIPAGRMASATEAARFAVHICQSSSYLNGQIITFDGAWQ
ncbi:MAG: elongation factor P 5-aminopentanone reductase [Coprococcus sp.]